MTEEGRLERDMIAALAALGFVIYRLSQGYRKARGGTRQTPGLPDLYAFHRSRQLTLWVEVKPPAEQARLARLLARASVPPSLVADYRRAVAQRTFGELCRSAGQRECVLRAQEGMGGAAIGWCFRSPCYRNRAER